MEEKQIIISIGREFGSGGHEIAEKLSKRLNLDLYDYNLLREVADTNNTSVDELAPYDEVPQKGLFSRTVRGYSNSPEKNIAYLQFEFLKNKAKEGKSFVVVGRCSEEALKEFPCLVTFFILADMDKKIERIERLYNVDKAKAQEIIRKQDKKRKAYHNYFCEGKWGDSRNYELSINSSKLGVEGTLDALSRYVNARMETL